MVKYDGTTRPAGELAYGARVSAQSASAHLAKLVEGGLLHAQTNGRHRYFRLANAEVAGVVEGLASLGEATRPRGPRAPLPSPAKILAAMLAARWLTVDGPNFALTRRGETELATLGVDLAAVRP